MFDTPDIARQQLLQSFERPQIELLVEALEPSIQFVPVAGGKVVLGGSRIGGTPDLPKDLDWPTPAFPANVADVATRGSPEANEELKAHFERRPPYAFFAQVDLGEAARLGGIGADLPAEGRLLFFYDLIAGPYETGVWPARVIWDRSPLGALAPRPLPKPLKTASDERRKADAEVDARLRKEYGDDAATKKSADAGTPYDGPSRAMRLATTLRPPATEALELESWPALKAELGKKSADFETTFQDSYSDLFSKRFDAYYGAANRGHRNQLLGGPLPEQSDPRYDAVGAADFGRRLTAEDWNKRSAELEAKARDWRLLLQIDVADWMQDDGEGTVYFLIRNGDFRDRRFDRVVAVYQQT